ncbi:MAG TPA: type III-B CRISPR module RAMP protein Cmr1 [Desulfosporosinus sp.]|nr:type III-B CRISPR module RAMP protein Cmr1 [Desulfosporosinus sp.]
MNVITFECEIITPMFLAGADVSKAELRPPSIKGALRFWWRALNGHLPLVDLQQHESAIFGGGGDKAVRSALSLRVKYPQRLNTSYGLPKNESKTITYGARNINVDLLKYLAYGAHDRPFININESFSVIFQYDNKIDLKSHILLPFYLVSIFGGLGARNRNGFGCFRIKSIIPNHEIDKDIGRFISKIKPVHPEKDFTCFSSGLKLYKTKTPQMEWNKVLGELGWAYLNARKSIDSLHNYDNRAYLATPIIQSRVPWHREERQAKQYFFSVTKNSHGSYDGWILFLPYKHPRNILKYKAATTSLNTLLKANLVELM